MDKTTALERVWGPEPTGQAALGREEMRLGWRSQDCAGPRQDGGLRRGRDGALGLGLAW